MFLLQDINAILERIKYTNCKQLHSESPLREFSPRIRAVLPFTWGGKMPRGALDS